MNQIVYCYIFSFNCMFVDPSKRKVYLSDDFTDTDCYVNYSINPEINDVKSKDSFLQDNNQILSDKYLDESEVLYSIQSMKKPYLNMEKRRSNKSKIWNKNNQNISLKGFFDKINSLIISRANYASDKKKNILKKQAQIDKISDKNVVVNSNDNLSALKRDIYEESYGFNSNKGETKRYTVITLPLNYI